MESETQPLKPDESLAADAAAKDDGAPGDPTVLSAELVSVNKNWKPALWSEPQRIVLENHSALGGANAAIALGIWTLLGASLTNWSFLNGVLGLLLGAWGLSSPKSRRAGLGMLLCAIGILLCMADIRGYFAGDRSNSIVAPVSDPFKMLGNETDSMSN